ncbi:major facilitator superfamily domain-containing protein [Apodospora peruviana]|uniref:Major facilitator superfamily domain-containing protein n=1 Tax=Apodospora peruviana TaxID=516989 RepID=A0AAE0IDF4_9PEZI|nr:major facilitator superfamily domain-containing protein [Apodospora peruviana]
MMVDTIKKAIDAEKPSPSASTASDKTAPKYTIPPATTTTVVTAGDGLASTKKRGKPARFWMIIVALSLLAFISALDAMIIGTALPTITAELGGSSVYVWIGNSFVLAASAVQPLVGQLSDIFGRKMPTVGSVVFFTLGSGLAGGAANPAMFIAGRAIQGIGAGGIYVLIDIIACDLVPLRDRGKWLGIINAWAGVAAALGPVLGGVLGQDNWRWIFYLNLPICTVALVTIVLFMHVNAGAATSSVRSLDVVGNFIFVPSIVSLLIGLVTGGVVHPWSSSRVVVPIVLGVVGWICFHLHQHFIAPNPMIPSRLFSNRTSAAGYILGFLSSVLVQAAGYFLPVYFQAVVGTTVMDSGVYFLPFAIGTLFAAAMGGVAMSHFGVYRPIHAVAFALAAIGFGLFTLLRSDTPKVAWAWYELIVVFGLGPTISTVLPAILAGLSQSDVAAASAVFSFIKTFGFVWGVSIPSIIFNGVVDSNLHSISDSKLQSQLVNGGAYAFASQAHDLAPTIGPVVWSEIVDVYIVSLKAVWWFGLALSILCVFAVAIEDKLHLSTELETDYGLQEKGPREKKKENLTADAGETSSTSV